MAHNSIQPEDHGRYYEGDAILIPFIIKDKHDDQPIDITGFTCEFYVKKDRTDADEEAIVEKIATQGEQDDGVEIDFTDPESGECKVIVETGDTDGLLTDDEIRSEEEEFFVAFRAIDSDGHRVTTVEATWPIHAS